MLQDTPDFKSKYLPTDRWSSIGALEFLLIPFHFPSGEKLSLSLSDRKQSNTLIPNPLCEEFLQVWVRNFPSFSYPESRFICALL